MGLHVLKTDPQLSRLRQNKHFDYHSKPGNDFNGFKRQKSKIVLITSQFFLIISYKRFFKYSKIFLKSFKLNTCILTTALNIPKLTIIYDKISIIYLYHISIYPSVPRCIHKSTCILK